MLIWIAVMIVAVFLDQLTKYLTVLYIKPIGTLPIIEDVIHLTYVENTGAAFGMMKNARWVFMITSTVAIIAILAYMFLVVPPKKRHWTENLCLSLIAAGGIGNMIDRTMLGYVVDMIDCRFINFAVFNVADSFVCIGCFCLIFGMIMSIIKIAREEKKLAAATAQAAGEAVSDGADNTPASSEKNAKDTTEDITEDTTEDTDHD